MCAKAYGVSGRNEEAATEVRAEELVAVSDEKRREHPRIAGVPSARPSINTLLCAWAALLARWYDQEEVALDVRVKNSSGPEEGAHSGTAPLLPPALVFPTTDATTFEELLRTTQFDIASLLGPASSDIVPSLDIVTTYALSDIRLLVSSSRDRTSMSVRTNEGQEFPGGDRMAQALELVLGQIAHAPQTRLGDLGILTESDRECLLRSARAIDRPYPVDQTIHGLFDQQVCRAPDAVAAQFGARTITYKELSTRAGRVAQYLASIGITAESRVAVAMDRGLEVLICLLGVLKGGGVYVPIDPNYPTDRIAYMLRDSAPLVVLTDRRNSARLACPEVRVVLFDEEWPIIRSQQQSGIIAGDLSSPSQLAFIIYTSGSTGHPKGAMNVHRGMVNRIASQDEVEAFAIGDVACQTTSLSYVDAVLEIFGSLCHGVPLIIIPEDEVRDLNRLSSSIEQHRVTRLVTVPSLARVMLESHKVMSRVSGLRSWTLSGEQVHPDLLLKLQSRLPECEFIIQYGSSEVSSDAAIYKTHGFVGDRVPLGSPVQNCRIYIFDRRGDPVPVGATGEIYVGGIGVGRGYLNRPDLTAERFLADPCAHHTGDRCYRTGDLGRWRDDGVLEYLGRSDFQVKVRGIRVELGEIESQLLRIPQVREAAVKAWRGDTGESQLVAYVSIGVTGKPSVDVGDRDGGDAKTEPKRPTYLKPVPYPASLRSYLATILPEHMVPAAYVILEELPKTPNGKLDRRAFPKPSVSAYSMGCYETPLGPIEQMLARVWEKVLDLPLVGRLDNFFELGGHSLKAISLLEKVETEGWSAAPRDIYERPVLADFARVLRAIDGLDMSAKVSGVQSGAQRISPEMVPLAELNADELEAVSTVVSGGPSNIEDIYRLTPLQEGILFHSLFDSQESDTYVRSILLSVPTQAHLDSLIVALQAMVHRHDVLRTAVFWERLPKPIQVVQREALLQIERLPARSGQSGRAQLVERAAQKLKMDLTRPPLMRVELAAAADGYYALIWTHHVLFDNESLETLLLELERYMSGEYSRPQAERRYRDHVARVLQQSSSEGVISFFRTKLARLAEPSAPLGVLELSKVDRPPSYATGRLEPKLTQRLASRARTLGVSVATLFHSAWSLVVSATSGRRDVVFGTVLLGRMSGGTGERHGLGLFINTLPIRLQLSDLSVRELIYQTQRELTELLRHEQASLAVVQQCAGVSAATPLFSALLNYRHSDPKLQEAGGSGTGITVLEVRGSTNYPVVASVDDFGEWHSITLETDSRIDAHRVAAYFKMSLESLADALEYEQGVSALTLEVVPMSERETVVHRFNEPKVQKKKAGFLHELFEDQVQRTPDSVALWSSGTCLTYAELSRRSNDVACRVKDRGIVIGDLVAIHAQRRIETIIGIIGILKAGAAYLPLDPTYPKERLSYMLRDASPKALVSYGEVESLEADGIDLIDLQSEGDQINALSSERLEGDSSVSDYRRLAYVIYTSGSTGKPKGVMVEHGNVTRLFRSTESWFNFSKADVWTLFHSLAFDFSVWELWGALLYGGKLLVLPFSTTRAPDEFYRLLCRERVSVLNQTPTAFGQLVEAQSRSTRQRLNLRVVIFGGEALEFRTLKSWMALNEAETPRLVNMYGITETTVHVTYRAVSSTDVHTERGSIVGRPIPDLRVYILDQELRPVGIGVAGELYVAGEGVARGYLNRPGLTAERFLADPFDGEYGRMYKTGDLGRWRDDGSIEYLGRNDFQVKIRGFRIELGEVEVQLSQHPEVKDVVVTVGEDIPGEKRLVAYVVPRREATTTFNTDELQQYLRSKLPTQAVPNVIVVLERFPLTENGKLDRQALPSPGGDVYGTRLYQSPEGPIEAPLSEIWARLLRLERVGRDDDFFVLGGHSLIAMKLLASVEAHFAVRISIAAVFRHPTVRLMAKIIETELAEDPKDTSVEGTAFEEGVV